MFPDPNVDGPDSIHWLYNTMSELYSDWLPGWQQQQTIKDGGYYSVRFIHMYYGYFGYTKSIIHCNTHLTT